MSQDINVCFDYSHGNKLVIESPSFIDFVEFLFTSGYKLGKIAAGINTVKKIEKYNLLIIGAPYNSVYSESEIKVLIEYVKKGGSLFIISNNGGDHTNKTNLFDLTKEFGFTFSPDRINDSVYYLNLQKRPIIKKFIHHSITEDLNSFVHSGGCSIDVVEYSEDKNIKIEIIAYGGLNCWREIYDGSNWNHDDCPNIPILVATKFNKGKVVAIGNVSMFSSLSREYGFGALDNSMLISNIFKWLSQEQISGGKAVSIKLKDSVYHWARNILDDQNWESISDVVNFSLKYLKDHYKNIIETTKKERIKKKKEYEKKKKTAAVKKKMAEDKILDMVGDKREKIDIDEIISDIDKVAGTDENTAQKKDNKNK